MAHVHHACEIEGNLGQCVQNESPKSFDIVYMDTNT